jgi:hypothetical protein
VGAVWRVGQRLSQQNAYDNVELDGILARVTSSMDGELRASAVCPLCVDFVEEPPVRAPALGICGAVSEADSWLFASRGEDGRRERNGVYSAGADIVPANIFGGAGGTGQYVDAIRDTTGYTIKLSTSGSVSGVNYFGYWLSALDPGNQIVFREGLRLRPCPLLMSSPRSGLARRATRGQGLMGIAETRSLDSVTTISSMLS